jgi:hypothetical protein
VNPFEALVKSRLKLNGQTMAQLGEVVGRKPGRISNLLRVIDSAPPFRPRAKNGPPEILEWADFLQLEGAERQRFLDLAAILHLPEGVRDRFVELLDEVADLRALASALEGRLDALEIAAPDRSSQVNDDTT